MASDVTGVNVYNAEATMHALRAFDTDASKALEKGLRAAIRPMVRAAQADVPDDPLSQWTRYGWTVERFRGKNRYDHDLGWNSAKVMRGIQIMLKGKRQRGRIVSSLAGIKSGNAAGAVYELAGTRTRNKFAKQLELLGAPHVSMSSHAQPNGVGKGRLILAQDTPANRKAVERAITALMHEAERTLQRHLDRME